MFVTKEKPPTGRRTTRMSGILSAQNTPLPIYACGTAVRKRIDGIPFEFREMSFIFVYILLYIICTRGRKIYIIIIIIGIIICTVVVLQVRVEVIGLGRRTRRIFTIIITISNMYR